MDAASKVAEAKVDAEKAAIESSATKSDADNADPDFSTATAPASPKCDALAVNLHDAIFVSPKDSTRAQVFSPIRANSTAA